MTVPLANIITIMVILLINIKTESVPTILKCVKIIIKNMVRSVIMNLILYDLLYSFGASLGSIVLIVCPIFFISIFCSQLTRQTFRILVFSASTVALLINCIVYTSFTTILYSVTISGVCSYFLLKRKVSDSSNEFTDSNSFENSDNPISYEKEISQETYEQDSNKTKMFPEPDDTDNELISNSPSNSVKNRTSKTVHLSIYTLIIIIFLAILLSISLCLCWHYATLNKELKNAISENSNLPSDVPTESETITTLETEYALQKYEQDVFEDGAIYAWWDGYKVYHNRKDCAKDTPRVYLRSSLRERNINPCHKCCNDPLVLHN